MLRGGVKCDSRGRPGLSRVVETQTGHRYRPATMPIRRELRYFYPTDWRQLSALVRFGRAKGRCERCGRPHGHAVHHLGDGRWWDEAAGTWRDGRGRKMAPPAFAEYKRLRRT